VSSSRSLFYLNIVAYFWIKIYSIINYKYKVIRKPGSRFFGEIYLAFDLVTGDELAVRLDPSKVKFCSADNQV
jgi:hypothetical protein